MCQAKSAENHVLGGGEREGGLIIKVTQNVLKHIFVLEFLKSDGIFEIGKIL